MRSRGLGAAIAAIVLVIGCGSETDPPQGTGGDGGSGATTGTTTSNGGNGAEAGMGGSGAAAGNGGNGGTPMFNGFTEVDNSGNAQDGSTHWAVAPNGTTYVVWVAGPDGNGDVQVARSTDGGATFEAAVTLDDGSITPIISKARHPWIAADNDQVVVTFGEQDGDVHVFTSTTTGALSFGSSTIVGGDINTTFRDFPMPVILADGSLGIAWHGYPAAGARVFFSRESNGWASEEVSGGAPGVPCECCPLDIVKTDSGEVMTAFRNNDSFIREFWIAGAPAAGAFDSWVAASNTEGTVNNCPMEGPRLAQLSGLDHAMVYSARGGPNVGSVMISYSDDGGSTWSGGDPIQGFTGDEPTVAQGPTGRLYVTAVTGNTASAMVFSDDNGGTWSTPEDLVATDGDIITPQLGGAAGVAALSGVSDGGTVWFLRME